MIHREKFLQAMVLLTEIATELYEAELEDVEKMKSQFLNLVEPLAAPLRGRKRKRPAPQTKTPLRLVTSLENSSCQHEEEG